MEMATTDLERAINAMQESNGIAETILAFQAMFAMSCFHAFKGIFNDVKPSNFLLVPLHDDCDDSSIDYPVRQLPEKIKNQRKKEKRRTIKVATKNKLVLCDFSHASLASTLGHQLPDGLTTIHFSAPEVIVGGPKFPLTQGRDVFAMFFVVMSILTREANFGHSFFRVLDANLDDAQTTSLEANVKILKAIIMRECTLMAEVRDDDDLTKLARHLYLYWHFVKYNSWEHDFKKMYGFDVFILTEDTDAFFQVWLEEAFSTAYVTLGIGMNTKQKTVFHSWVMRMLHTDPARRPTMGELLLHLTVVFEPKMKEKNTT
jgi:serine/threonine protein kinase